MVIRCEAGTEVGECAVLHPHLHHGNVFFGILLVVQCGLHGTQIDRLADQVKQDVRVVGKDLPDDTGVALGDFFRVVDVVHDVGRDDLAEVAVVHQFLCPRHAGFVHVVVPR